MRLVAAAAAVCVALITAYLALGGASYEPFDVADPCEARALERPEGVERTLQTIALSALDGAACELQVPREELALALADPVEREEFASEHGVGEDEVEGAVEEGLLRAVDDAERLDLVPGFVAALLREAAAAVPIGLLIDALETASDDDPIGLLTELLAES